MIAFLEAHRAKLFSSNNILRNVISGIVVGIVALPLAMGFAIASGAKPEQGIYTAIVAGLIVSIFGGSRVQIAGPTGAFIVILSGITAQYGFEGLQIATLMGGCILVLLGVSRLGGVIKFVPSPVVVGFTAGIGVIIFVGQWKDFFGLSSIVPAAHVHEKILHLLKELPHAHLPTTGLGLLSLFLVIATPYLFKKIPGPLLAMVVATGIEAYFKFDGVATIGSAFGGIPHNLPVFHLPDVTLSKMIQLAGPALAIAGLGAIESLLSATVADGMTGTRHDSNQELIGQGIANIFSPLFGGFSATGAIARTATNIRMGGNSPLAGIIHSCTLILTILLIAPLAVYIPLCALSAILFVVAYNMSDLHHFARMLRSAPRYDVITLLITFFLTIFVDLVVAVNVGVILASLMFMKRMASSVRVERHTSQRLKKQVDRGVMVYTIEGPLFFGAVETFESTMAAIHENPTIVIFCFRNVPFIDITGIQAFQGAIEQFTRRGVRIILCEVNRPVQVKLKRAGILKLIGKKNVFAMLSEALTEAA